MAKNKTHLKNTKKSNSFDERIKKYILNMNETAKSLDLNVTPIVNFKSGKPNFIGKFAMKLLRISGGILDTQFINTKK